MQYPTFSFKALLSKIRAIIPHGTKKVNLENGGYYGTHDFRYRVVDGLTLHKGEVLYFEIVGWVSETTPIMPAQPIRDELKDVKKSFGEEMRYPYGLAPGQADVYVYKIVRMNEEGVAVDLSWPAVKARCRELGVKHVPELSGPFIHERVESTQEEVERLTQGLSTVDPSHIREGVVLRVESDEGISYVKNKSWLFGILEGYIKDLDSYVDLEEVS